MVGFFMKCNTGLEWVMFITKFTGLEWVMFITKLYDVLLIII